MSSWPRCFSLTAVATPAKPAPTIATETFRAMWRKLLAGRECVEPSQTRIVPSRELLDRGADGADVQGPGLGHRLEIGPVACAVEHHLEHGELDGTEDRDLLAFERDGAPVPCGLLVQRDVVE